MTQVQQDPAAPPRESDDHAFHAGEFNSPTDRAASGERLSSTTRREYLGQTTVSGHGAREAPMLTVLTGEAAAPDAEAERPREVPVRLRINGRETALTVDTRASLLDTLRDHLHLTGTKKGCDHGQCGACTVLVGGRRVNACLTLTVTAEGDDVVTVEGLATGDQLHPMQRAFITHDGFQCGYCTPGQICSAIGMLAEVRDGWPSYVTPNVRDAVSLEGLSDPELRERMSGNICRCGAYDGIFAAVREVIGDGPNTWAPHTPSDGGELPA